MKYNYLFHILLLSALLAIDKTYVQQHKPSIDPFRQSSAAKIGDNPFPPNPMNDRAKGYIDQGRIKTAVTNYGTFINWDTHPSGIWGDLLQESRVIQIQRITPGRSLKPL